jgi:hypothetical protein
MVTVSSTRKFTTFVKSHLVIGGRMKRSSAAQSNDSGRSEDTSVPSCPPGDNLLFELYVQSPTCEIELVSLDWRHNIDHNTVLILHRYPTAAAEWSLSSNFVVLAIKIFGGFLN